MEKYGFIYLWRDRKHKKYYIGCHWGTVDDGYICSSTNMRNAFNRRPDDFKRRILKSNIDKINLRNEEHKYLLMIHNSELGKKYYNLSKANFKNHQGIASTEEKEKQRRLKLSIANGDRLRSYEPWNRNKKGYRIKPKKYEYHIKGPDGLNYIEYGLNSFCRERNIQPDNLRKRGEASGYKIIKRIDLNTNIIPFAKPSPRKGMKYKSSNISKGNIKAVKEGRRIYKPLSNETKQKISNSKRKSK